MYPKKAPYILEDGAKEIFYGALLVAAVNQRKSAGPIFFAIEALRILRKK